MRMKAALLKAWGQALVIDDVAVPEPGAGQVLIRVRACGVCHTDLHLARGEWEHFKAFMSLPVILGHEVAGTVERIGPSVTRLQEGDAVGVAWFHRTCGTCDYCRQDIEVYCDTPAITGVTVPGGLGEYLLAWESHALAIPAELETTEAAPLFCAGGTVYSALRKVDLSGSARLGVWGIGGLGHIAIQLGKLAGAHVTAVDVAPEKLQMAADLGADMVVAGERVLDWFEDPAHRVDVALICAASVEAYQVALKCLRKRGTLLVVGLPPRPLNWFPADLVRSGVRVLPSRVSSRQELREVLKLAAAGKIRSRVRRFALQDVNQVLDLLERGEISGRAVIEF